jgi:hypothetical protein
VVICVHLLETLQQFKPIQSSGEFSRRFSQIFPQMSADK